MKTNYMRYLVYTSMVNIMTDVVDTEPDPGEERYFCASIVVFTILILILYKSVPFWRWIQPFGSRRLKSPE